MSVYLITKMFIFENYQNLLFQNPFDVIKLVFMPTDGGRELSLTER